MLHNFTKLLGLTAACCVGLAIIIGPAQAEETFICDDGRVLTLRPEQVEALVATDPCIAKYYGREVTKAPPPQLAQPPSPQPVPAFETAPAAAPTPAAEPPPAVPVDLPLPQRKPASIAGKLRTLRVDPTAPAAERKPVAVADVPSDFRNVHIINAGKVGAPEYYRHTR